MSRNLKSIFTLLVVAVAPLACVAAEGQTSGIRRTEDVIYSRKFGMALIMDVFQPAKPNGCGLLFLVNGGWLSSKETPLMVTIRPSDYQIFLDHGYTVFAVVTSSQPKFKIPELMQDELLGNERQTMKHSLAHVAILSRRDQHIAHLISLIRKTP